MRHSFWTWFKSDLFYHLFMTICIAFIILRIVLWIVAPKWVLFSLYSREKPAL